MTIQTNDHHYAIGQLYDIMVHTPHSLYDVVLHVKHATRFAVVMPWLTASPMDNFADSLSFLAANRKTILAFLQDIVIERQKTGRDRFLFRAFNDALIFEVNGKVVDLHVASDHELLLTEPQSPEASLLVKMQRYAMLQMLAAEKFGCYTGELHYYALHVETESANTGFGKATGDYFSSPYGRADTVLGTELFDGQASQFLEDVAMLTNERVTIGLRNRWTRKVATPVVQCLRHLHQANTTKAIEAAKIVAQCDDAPLRDACVKWIVHNYKLKESDINDKTVDISDSLRNDMVSGGSNLRT